MSAPMTRGRLALIRDEYKPALDSYDSEDFVEVCVADLRELVSACESLLNERDNLQLQIRTLANGDAANRALADDIERWRTEASAKIADARDAALEEAAQWSIGCFDRDGNAAPERIRALKGKR